MSTFHVEFKQRTLLARIFHKRGFALNETPDKLLLEMLHKNQGLMDSAPYGLQRSYWVLKYQADDAQ